MKRIKTLIAWCSKTHKVVTISRCPMHIGTATGVEKSLLARLSTSIITKHIKNFLFHNTWNNHNIFGHMPQNSNSKSVCIIHYRLKNKEALMKY